MNERGKKKRRRENGESYERREMKLNENRK
jgi:hypothetical protein